MIEFVRLENDEMQIAEMSAMATAIVREHFDPLIGRKQNDYMIAMFQTPQAIAQQLEKGYRYYFVTEDKRNIGFIAFYPKKDAMYLSKFYLYKNERAKGHAHAMMTFIESETLKAGLKAIELNVNRFNNAVRAYEKLGFEIIREEKNEIGHGFVMDDYVFRKQL
jgi:ribosomal protein S18 acetylase RimI-like enzyme